MKFSLFIHILFYRFIDGQVYFIFWESSLFLLFFKHFSMSLPFPFFLFIQALHDEYELALLGLAEQLKAQKEKQAKFLKKKLLLKKIAREKELVRTCTKLKFSFQLLCNSSTSMGRLVIVLNLFLFIFYC